MTLKKKTIELYEMIKKFHKENPEVPLLFITTDRVSVPHIISDHPSELISALSSIPSSAFDEFAKAVIKRANELQKKN